MSLKTFVKISKVENLSDARYCAGMMVDVLGFNLEQGTNGYVDPKKFEEITGWLAGVRFCGEFSNSSLTEIKNAIENYKIDLVEIQNHEFLSELKSENLNLIYKLTINQEADLESLNTKIQTSQSHADHIIIKSENSSLYHEIMNKLELINDKHNLIIGFDLNSENVLELASSDFQGIELEGTPEDRPGFKDYDAVMDILELLELA